MEDTSNYHDLYQYGSRQRDGISHKGKETVQTSRPLPADTLDLNAFLKQNLTSVKSVKDNKTKTTPSA